ncbi:hypothetical protein ACIPY5_19840 [Microbacterium sp. NPDC089698]|uniref:hypothetical protein n=1 Tax=Microbacterium sp. NPDC089698 TaxID=3364200 RepID=UPI00381D63AC
MDVRNAGEQRPGLLYLDSQEAAGLVETLREYADYHSRIAGELLSVEPGDEAETIGNDPRYIANPGLAQQDREVDARQANDAARSHDAYSDSFRSLADQVERSGQIDVANESTRAALVESIDSWGWDAETVPPRMRRVVDAIAPSNAPETSQPFIHLSDLERGTFVGALRGSIFDEDHALAEQIERDAGQVRLTEANTATILNYFYSGPRVQPEHMAGIVAQAHTEYQRRIYDNLSIDSAGEDDIDRRWLAAEHEAADLDEQQDLAQDLDSLQTRNRDRLFHSKLDAFEESLSRHLGAARADLQVWEPDVDHDRPHVGIARPSAQETDVVTVTFDPASGRIETSTFDPAHPMPVDLATAARMLGMTAPEARVALDATADSLRAASELTTPGADEDLARPHVIATAENTAAADALLERMMAVADKEPSPLWLWGDPDAPAEATAARTQHER